MSYRFDCAEPSGRGNAIATAVTTLAAGDLVVLPTGTVYGVGCDAFSPPAVAALHAARGATRHQPPPVLIAHWRTLDGIAADLTDAARALAEAFWPGGLTLVCQAQPSLHWNLGDTHGTVAVRMPLHPLALELLDEVGPMAVTGANLAGMPAVLDCDRAQAALGDAVAVYLDAGPLTGGPPSTILDVSTERVRVLRLGEVSLEQLREVAGGELQPPSGVAV